MTPREAIDAVESRAFALRLTMTDLCRIAQVNRSSWSRAKSRGSIRPKTLGKMEDTLNYLERQRAHRDAAATGPADQVDA